MENKKLILSALSAFFLIVTSPANAETDEEEYAAKGHAPIPVDQFLDFSAGSVVKFTFENARGSTGTSSYHSNNEVEVVIELPKYRELNGEWNKKDKFTICRQYPDFDKVFCARYYKSGDNKFKSFNDDGRFSADLELEQ